MGRVKSKKVSENNVLIKIKIIKYKMTMSILLLIITLLLIHLNTLKQAIQKNMSGREYVNIPTNVISS
jgi:hypothetical protein